MAGEARSLLAGDAWIADGNYHETLDLRLDRADTVVVLDTPWWVCAGRAFVRGVRRPVGSVMPEGCDDSVIRRLGTSGDWSGSTGGTVEGGPSENRRSSPSTGTRRPCTCSVRSVPSEHFSPSAAETNSGLELAATSAGRRQDSTNDANIA